MAPVLAYPRFGEGVEFVLETDASTCGLGAVLSQRQEDGRLHPVAYASRKLQPAEENYPITELETLGIVWAVKYFRSYLLGHKVIVFTDHVACTSLLNCSNPSPKLARWAMIIQEMDLTIKHRHGKSNSNADTLSRLPSQSTNLEQLVNVDEAPAGGNSGDMAAHANTVGEAQTCGNVCEAAAKTDSCENKPRIDRANETDLSILCTREASSCVERDSISCPYLVCSVNVPAGNDLRQLQKDDAIIGPMLKYLEENELPVDQKVLKRVIAEGSQFSVLDGVLHFDGSSSSAEPRIVVPECLKEALLREAHG